MTWSSSNKKVATVDKNGVVTAVKKGTVTITAKTSGGKKATCKSDGKSTGNQGKIKQNQGDCCKGQDSDLKSDYDTFFLNR